MQGRVNANLEERGEIHTETQTRRDHPGILVMKEAQKVDGAVRGSLNSSDNSDKHTTQAPWILQAFLVRAPQKRTERPACRPELVSMKFRVHEAKYLKMLTVLPRLQSSSHKLIMRCVWRTNNDKLNRLIHHDVLKALMDLDIYSKSLLHFPAWRFRVAFEYGMKFEQFGQREEEWDMESKTRQAYAEYAGLDGRHRSTSGSTRTAFILVLEHRRQLTRRRECRGLAVIASEAHGSAGIFRVSIKFWALNNQTNQLKLSSELARL